MEFPLWHFFIFLAKAAKNSNSILEFCLPFAQSGQPVDVVLEGDISSVHTVPNTGDATPMIRMRVQGSSLKAAYRVLVYYAADGTANMVDPIQNEVNAQAKKTLKKPFFGGYSYSQIMGIFEATHDPYITFAVPFEGKLGDEQVPVKVVLTFTAPSYMIMSQGFTEFTREEALTAFMAEQMPKASGPDNS
jgi:hypothetical protein